MIHKGLEPELSRRVSDVLTASIQFSLDHQPEAVAHSLQWARGLEHDLADRFVGMYVNPWTLDYGECARESICPFLGRGQALGVISKEFLV